MYCTCLLYVVIIVDHVFTFKTDLEHIFSS